MSGPANAITVHRGDGTIVSFALQAGTYVPEANVNDRVQAVSGGYQYVDAARMTVESYTSQGRLTRVDGADGSSLTFTYSTTANTQAPAPGYLLQAADGDGRALNFQYTLPVGLTGADALTKGVITRVSDAAGRSINIAYDGQGNHQSTTWPDGRALQFRYENSATPWAMTGRIDENSVRDADWSYDSLGRAFATARPLGAESYAVEYQVPPQAFLHEWEDRPAALLYRRYETILPQGISITGPNGLSFSWDATSVLGTPQMTGASQPTGSGSTASNSAMTYDAVGNVLSKDDFQGQRVCYAYDASNRETVRVEGLATMAACSGVIAAGATLPAGSRKITTAWHADWRLPVVVTQPLKKTTTVYHGQPDPFNGGAVANCTSAAALPNGAALPLACKQLEQALTAAGAVDTTVAANSTSYTYDAAGRVLTSTDANNRTTTNVYYAATAFTGVDPDAIGHTAGDLQTVSNAAGHVTQYTQYDKAGRVRQSVDARGVVTDIVYTPRGWVSTVTLTPPGASGRTTAYGYDNAGQRTSVSLPDGTSLGYGYDAAHRLTGVTDARGNAITYILDAAGNKTGEEVRDPSGTLQRSISRSFDALNRLQQVSGAAQ
ncbi:hypothetical protein [Ramlibacter sp.]|uniref:hypothetical protein n=1 Tax=Ramlibacter sp. TaxID=1917967 RepID=UPI00180FD319|nr:hypothetical protein [Ramlibacter sp.]MBA2673403.1 RHS repeat protein [Ramlibacter sp.]